MNLNTNTSFRFILVVILILFTFGCKSEKKIVDMAERGNKEGTNQTFNTQEYVDAWVSMWNSYDLSLVDKLFLADSRITYFSSEKEGLIKGIEAVREHHKGFGFVNGGKIQENKLWIEDLQTNIYWPVAIVSGVWFFRRGPEDSEDISRGPVTFVYIKEGKEFRLAHLHFANY